MGSDSILPESGGLSDYSDTKARREMPQGRMVSFYLRFGHSYVPGNSYPWGIYSFSAVLAGARSQVEFDTKEDIFAALTDIESTEKIYLANGVYKRNTALGNSWDLKIVHEGDQQVISHGEGDVFAGAPVDLSVFLPYFKNLCKRNGYPFIGTVEKTPQQ